MKLKLIGKRLEAKGTKSFIFEKPTDFNYLPGQFYYFTLDKLSYPDKRGVTRHFTLSSSPTEKEIMFTTRMREESGYKKTFDELKNGSPISVDGPNGTLVFDENEKEQNHVFIAGGIGITPYRSIIKYLIDKKINRKILLIYSNNTEDVPFKKEFDKWQKESNFLKVNYFNSKVSGHLDKGKLEKIILDSKFDMQGSVFWVCGPPLFIDSMEDILDEMGVSSGKINSEKFTGY